MCKSEIFERIAAAVAAEMELPVAEVLSQRKTTEVVDARYLLIRISLDKGLYRADVARRTGLTPQAVGRIYTCFDARCEQNQLLRPAVNQIRTKLETD